MSCPLINSLEIKVSKQIIEAFLILLFGCPIFQTREGSMMSLRKLREYSELSLGVKVDTKTLNDSSAEKRVIKSFYNFTE